MNRRQAEVAAARAPKESSHAGAKPELPVCGQVAPDTNLTIGNNAKVENQNRKETPKMTFNALVIAYEDSSHDDKRGRVEQETMTFGMRTVLIDQSQPDLLEETKKFKIVGCRVPPAPSDVMLRHEASPILPDRPGKKREMLRASG